MEQFLFFAFRKVFGEDEVINRDKTIIGKEVDIFIPSMSFAVEIGSWTWHKNVIESDKSKIKACCDKNIQLIVIYDSYNDGIIVNENIWTYPFNLGGEKQYDTLKSIVKKCLKLMGINSFSFNRNDWEKVISSAYHASQRVSHKDFLTKLEGKNEHYQNIIIQSEYKSAHDKISCKCKKCGNEWETAASELLKGTGCPSCQIKAVGNSRSKKELIIEWRKNNPSGSKLRCEEETGISRMTVYKWWNAED